jgi:hypothetical protein
LTSLLLLIGLIGGSHARPHQYQPILLSSAVASAAKDSIPKRTSNAVSGSCMATKNSSKNLVVTTRVPAVRAADFKKCCLGTGAFDGERRNHFFQRIAMRDGGLKCRRLDFVYASVSMILHWPKSSMYSGLPARSWGSRSRLTPCTSLPYSEVSDRRNRGSIGIRVSGIGAPQRRRADGDGILHRLCAGRSSGHSRRRRLSQGSLG